MRRISEFERAKLNITKLHRLSLVTMPCGAVYTAIRFNRHFYQILFPPQNRKTGFYGTINMFNLNLQLSSIGAFKKSDDRSA